MVEKKEVWKMVRFGFNAVKMGWWGLGQNP